VLSGALFPGRNSISLFGYDYVQEILHLCLDAGNSVSLCGYKRFGIFVRIRFANVFMNM
jgi:hypothetical protein